MMEVGLPQNTGTPVPTSQDKAHLFSLGSDLPVCQGLPQC